MGITVLLLLGSVDNVLYQNGSGENASVRQQKRISGGY